MPKTIHLDNSQWFWTFVIASSLVFPTLGLGAQTEVDTLTPKVKVVRVIKDGTALRVLPVTVKVHRKAEIVVWVTDGKKMTIDFKKGNPAPGNPFTDLTCPGGQFCGALTPPDVAPAVFAYKVTVDGVVLDPKVEVIP
jgi:hypothetical protein